MCFFLTLTGVFLQWPVFITSRIVLTNFLFLSQSFEEPTVRMADAETLLMETSDQNGAEGEEDQNGAEQELMGGEEDLLDSQEGQEGQDNGADGGKIDASKGEEDAG